jgi:hypothetical protein
LIASACIGILFQEFFQEGHFGDGGSMNSLDSVSVDYPVIEGALQ